mmetsp:Transcript_12124/g.36403  ORF Transcript_12124/g.36403 Transcript_12124/m.36403 type:complete len:203 (-) Transcript_12124:2788-3396(-)
MQLNHLLHAPQQRHLGPPIHLRQLPPRGQQEAGGGLGILFRLRHLAVHDVQVRRHYVRRHAGLRVHGTGDDIDTEGVPVRGNVAPQGLCLQQDVISATRILGDHLPLAQLLGRVQVGLVPQHLLVLLNGVLLPGLAHDVQQHVLGGRQQAGRQQGQGGAGVLCAAPPPPQPVQQILLPKLLVQRRKGIEAAGVVGEERHVGL